MSISPPAPAPRAGHPAFAAALRSLDDRLDATARGGPLPPLRRTRATCPGRSVRAARRRQRTRGGRLVLQRLPRHEPAPGGRGGGVPGARRAWCRIWRDAQHRRLAPARARARGRARRPALPGSRARVHVGFHRQRRQPARARQSARGLRDPLRRAQPRIDDRRHPLVASRARDLPAQRRGAPA